MATRERRIEHQADLEWVRLGQTSVPELAQRDLNKNKVKALYSDFDPDQLGVPVLSFRQGKYNILDGQHRIQALKMYLGEGWEDQKVYAEVYKNLTEADEAEIFLRRNNALQVTAFDKFRIGVNANRPEEVKILKIVESVGLTVSKQKIEGAVSCVGALQTVYRRSGGDRTLARTLKIAYGAFGDSGLQAVVIGGLGHLVLRYSAIIKDPEVIKKLSVTHNGVYGFLQLAETLRMRHGRPKQESVAAAAVEIINKGKGGKKLPKWWA